MCGAHALATQEGRGMETASAALRQTICCNFQRSRCPGLSWCGVGWSGVFSRVCAPPQTKQIDKQTMQPLPAASRLNWPEGAQEKAHSALSNLKMIKAGWPAGRQAGSRQHTVIQHSSNELVSRNTAYATLREGRVVELVAHSSLSVTWQDEL